MSTNEVRTNDAAESASVSTVDMKLEVVVIPVSDVDRAKEFYSRLGWRLDADRSADDNFRLVQFTTPVHEGIELWKGKSRRPTLRLMSHSRISVVGRTQRFRTELNLLGEEGPSRDAQTVAHRLNKPRVRGVRASCNSESGKQKRDSPFGSRAQDL
jgi:catechol 2,3-dioxygenase-like lactoylglutathione lyase family enzyme